MVDRIFYAAVGIQVLHWLLSFVVGPEVWALQGLFWIWVALVPFIGFFGGREGKGLGKSGGLVALLFLMWFFVGTLNAVFLSLSSTVSPTDWLTGMGAFTLSSILFGAAACLVAIVAAVIGRRFRVQSSA